MGADDEVYDLELMRSLIAAVPAHPTLDSACATCCIDPDTVRNWIRRGRSPDAPEVLHRFSMAMQRAEGQHASSLYAMFLSLIARGIAGAASAKILLEVMDRRWKFGADVHLLNIPKSPKRTDDIRAMLLKPSARLRAMLAETGWSRAPDWRPATPLLKAAPVDSDDEEG